MSVLTPVVDAWDGTARLIFLKQGVSDYYPIEDLYHEYRNERRTNEDLRKYEPFLRAEGNIPKGAGAFTPRYVVLLDGTKIVPYDEVLRINQLGDMITDDPDVDPSLYDVSTLTVPKVIFIKPSEAETIQLNSESIVYSSFQGGVWLDPDSIYDDEGSATQPNGNTERPVNNLPLAVQIANTRGFDKLFINKSMTLDNGIDITNFTIIGKSPTHTYINIDPSIICNNLNIQSCNITGTLDGGTEINHCSIGDLTYVNGHIHYSGLYGTIILNGNKSAIINDCYTIDQDNVPVIDMGGSGQDLVMLNYSGLVSVKNMDSTSEEIAVGIDAGVVTLENTITAGTIIVSGVGQLVDNSTGSATVDSDGLISKETISAAVYDEIGSEIQYASFNNAVHIDVVNGVSGTTYNIGTSENPVNNIPDAVNIANGKGFEKICVHGNLALGAGDIVDGFEINGQSTIKSNIIIDSTASVVDCIFFNATISGTLDGNAELERCVIGNLDYIEGKIYLCTLTGVITLCGTSNTRIYNCFDGCPGSGENPIIDMGGSGKGLNLRGYSGGIELRNKTGPEEVSMDIITGHVLLQDTVINGIITIRGLGSVVDNSTGSTVVNDYSVDRVVLEGKLNDIDKKTKLIPGLL